MAVILGANMHLAKRPLSKHHRARLIVWALAMLTWMASLLLGAPLSPRHAQQRGRVSLSRLAAMVRMLIISRAIDFARLRFPKRLRSPQKHRGRDISRSGLIRALIGSHVRRALKRRSASARIMALMHALIHIDTFAARVAKRIKRRLTRLDPIAAAPDAGIALFAGARAPAFSVDSS
jgi:hypothetical protein